MAVLGAARVAKVRRLIYAASSSAYGDAPTLPKSEDMAPNPPISWKPRAKSIAMIQVPPAASSDMATVVVLVVSKGGNPAAGPNRKKHWTGWFGRRLPAALLRPVF